MNDYIWYDSYSHWGMFPSGGYFSEYYGIWLWPMRIRPEWASIIG